jgi:hypothetical protein
VLTFLCRAILLLCASQLSCHIFHVSQYTSCLTLFGKNLSFATLTLLFQRVKQRKLLIHHLVLEVPNFLSSSYILDINPLLGEYFLPFCRLSLYSGNCSFAVQKLFNLMQSHLLIFTIYFLNYWSTIQKTLSYAYILK